MQVPTFTVGVILCKIRILIYLDAALASTVITIGVPLDFGGGCLGESG